MIFFFSFAHFLNKTIKPQCKSIFRMGLFGAAHRWGGGGGGSKKAPPP